MPKNNHASRPIRAGRAVVDEKVRALHERFARFRAERGRGARVPAELRAAALAALRRGASQGAVQSCGISRSQLDAWKRRAARDVADMGRAGPEDVRVFSVVDEARPVAGRARAAEPVLELRAGPWAVTVRLAVEPLGGP
jgi:hypothetical protein